MSERGDETAKETTSETEGQRVRERERAKERERERERERRLPVEPGRNQPPNSREWKLLTLRINYVTVKYMRTTHTQNNI